LGNKVEPDFAEKSISCLDIAGTKTEFSANAWTDIKEIMKTVRDNNLGGKNNVSLPIGYIYSEHTQKMYKTLLYETPASKFIEKQLSWPIWGLMDHFWMQFNITPSLNGNDKLKPSLM